MGITYNFINRSFSSKWQSTCQTAVSELVKSGHLYTIHTVLLHASGTLLQGPGWSLPQHVHAHAHTHVNKHTLLLLSCHISMEMAWGEVRIGALSFTNPLEGQSREAPAFFHPQAISTPAALHSLSCLPLIWYFHKDDICIRQSRKCPGSTEYSFLTGVTSDLHRPASDVLTIQLTSTSCWVGAST